jgi:hypothetical protein
MAFLIVTKKAESIRVAARAAAHLTSGASEAAIVDRLRSKYSQESATLEAAALAQLESEVPAKQTPQSTGTMGRAPEGWFVSNLTEEYPANSVEEQIRLYIENSPEEQLRRHIENSPAEQLRRHIENSPTERMRRFLENKRKNKPW